MRRRTLGLGGLGAVALVVVLVASGCVLSGAWSETTPVEPWTETQLTAVSCLAPNDCYGVATRADGPAAAALQHWDGSAWTVVATTTQTNFSSMGRNGLDCWAPDGCMALAWEQLAPAPTSLLWNGTTLRKLKRMSVNGPQLECASAVWCAAVDNDGPVMDVWDGAQWVQDPTAFPSTADGARDCSGVRECVRAQYREGQVEHLVGATRTTSTLPSGVAPFALTCLSASWCVAVGEAGSATWDGTAWTARPLDMGAPDDDDETTTFSGVVDCAATSACLAIGWTGSPFHSAPTSPPMAKVMYAGTTWADAPALPATMKVVADIDCPTGGKVCYVAGLDASGTSRVWTYDWTPSS